MLFASQKFSFPAHAAAVLPCIRITANRFRMASAVCVAFAAVAIMGSLAYASPEVPGKPQDHPVALVNATIHPVSGPEIPGGIILFTDGKIAAVGTDVALPDGTEQIDVADQHVYPGLFDAHSHLGLTEIAAVRATRDLAEVGSINPNVKALVAINPDSELIPVTRSSGILTVVTAPTGGLISGCAAVVALDGWTWEDMAIKPAAGMQLAWPQMTPSLAWFAEASPADQLQTRDKALAELSAALADARAYQAAHDAHASGGGPRPPFDARWEAMLGVLKGDLPLLIEADTIEQIQSALAFADRERLKVILVGGYDAPLCAELIKKHDVSVIVAGVHRLPRRADDPYDAAYSVPARLYEAGVRFCICGNDRDANVRNLPYHAAMAAAFGLPPAEALKAITQYPAEVFGLGDRMGTLDAGKDATLIVTSGDPLEIPTQVSMAFIRGRQVDLSDRHKRLWAKYKEKYRRLGIENP